MSKPDRRRKILTIISILIVVSIGAIIAAVIISQKGEKSNVEQEDWTFSSSNPSERPVKPGIFSSEGKSDTQTLLASEVSSTGTINADEVAKPGSITSSIEIAMSSSCRNPQIRKEWRDLSKKEQLNFMNVFNEMFKKPSRKGYENLHMDFVKTHIDNKKEIHNTTVFLLWHRQFIYEYEKELRAIDPSVSLPYWDWGMDYENPSKSPLFEDDAFGGTGDSSTGCIKTGKFAEIQTQFNENENSHHCVRRAFGSTVKTLSAPSLMMGYALLNEFNDFTRSFESASHALAHNFVGGDMITNQSPSDPLFFLVHANVDRYFLIWQKNHPNGKYPDNLEKKLPAYEIPLSAVFKNPLTTDYCYSYSSAPTQSVRKREDSSSAHEPSKVIYPSRVPFKFTRQMGGDPKIVQKLEDKSVNFIDCLNTQGFESPASLYSADRNWKNHQIKNGISRFGKNSNSRQILERCVKHLEGVF